MPDSLLRSIDLYSKMNLEDRATAILQPGDQGLRVKLEQTVLDQFKKGRTTIRQGAVLLGKLSAKLSEAAGYIYGIGGATSFCGLLPPVPEPRRRSC